MRGSSFLTAGSIADMGFSNGPSGKAINLYQLLLCGGPPSIFFTASGWLTLTLFSAMRADKVALFDEIVSCGLPGALKTSLEGRTILVV